MSKNHSTASAKPHKPSPDFPLFPHATGRWAKKIKGKMHCFGRWGDPEGALREYRGFLAGKGRAKKKAGVKGSKPATERPAKLSPNFPLFPHDAGVWAKNIRGKMHYFGTWADPDAALAKYLEQKDDLHAGREPRAAPGDLTVKEAVNDFLNAKKDLAAAGELTQRTLDDYEEVCVLPDWDRMIEWEKRHFRTSPPGWETNAGLAPLVGCHSTHDWIMLRFALARFVDECDEGFVWVREPGASKHGKGRIYYDPAAFRRWLNGRSVKEAAGPRETFTKKKDRRRQETVLFLYFILTRGAFDQRLFNRFLNKPPYGKELKPCKPVPASTGRAWAQEAGYLPGMKRLDEAKRIAGVQSVRKKKAGTFRHSWSLPGPVVVIPRPEGPVARDAPRDQIKTPAAGDGQPPAEPAGKPAKKGRGRPTGRTDKKEKFYKSIRNEWQEDRRRPEAERNEWTCKTAIRNEWTCTAGARLSALSGPGRDVLRLLPDREVQAADGRAVGSGARHPVLALRPVLLAARRGRPR
jgi:hypothetical protein